MAKAPKPWMLTEDESFSSFRNWKRTIIYNLKAEKKYTAFLKANVTWEAFTSANPDRGQADDEDMAAEGAVSKEVKAENLNDMLGYIAQYSPVELNTEISCNNTSLDEVWQSIRDYFGFKQSEAQFLKYSSLKWETNERPEKLYRKVVAHLQDNLLTTDCDLLHNKKKPIANEEMSPTVERLAVIKWMELIDPDLPALVGRTFAHDLQIKTLKDLQPQIRDSMEHLLEQLKDKRADLQASKVRAEESVMAAQSGTDRFQSKPRPTFGRPRTFNKPASKFTMNASGQSRKECSVCRAAHRRFTGHTYMECDYVSKAEKREAIKSCKAVVDDGAYGEDPNDLYDNFEECDINDSA